ncbi:MAG: tetratricopeptide repeat protein [Desulfobacterales bacterium]|nr:tetratricopeptide repeat protein [Desulfobacterales bacterium]
MGAAAQIKTLLKEADLYQQQGLLNEAKERYKKATEILKANADIANGQELIKSIVKKVVALNQAINRINDATTKPEVSGQKQDLIKNLFSGVREGDGGQRDLEGAIALAKFGQFDRALSEFDRLLADNTVRVAAAKNIIRCCIELEDLDQAVKRFAAWVKDDGFKDSELKKIRFFLDNRLRNLDHDCTLPERTPVLEVEDIEVDHQASDKTSEGPAGFVDEVEAESVDFDSELELHEEEFLDINSVGIQLPAGGPKGQMFEFDVSFQTGNSINLIIPSTEKTLLKELKAGTKLPEMQFFSPIAILNGSGVVTSKTRIKSGPKEGDYSLDITILTT